MHDILFALQESHDCKSGIEIMVDGTAVGEHSDGLHGEIFGDEGWIVRFSSHPSPREIERSRQAERNIQETFEGEKKGGGKRA